MGKKPLPKSPPEEFVFECIDEADKYSRACKLLLDIVLSTMEGSDLMDVAGYLAAHACELYLKAYLVSFTLNYRLIVSLGHDLEKILAELKKYDKEVVTISAVIKTINKYSGGKMRYPEETTDGELYGTDEIQQVVRIQSYVKRKLNY